VAAMLLGHHPSRRSMFFERQLCLGEFHSQILGIVNWPGVIAAGAPNPPEIMVLFDFTKGSAAGSRSRIAHKLQKKSEKCTSFRFR
jgi:hypothetical protein